MHYNHYIVFMLLVCIMGHDWLNGSTEIGTIYLYRSDDQFDGVVGLRVSLYDCNVTLKGKLKVSTVKVV